MKDMLKTIIFGLGILSGLYLLADKVSGQISSSSNNPITYLADRYVTFGDYANPLEGMFNFYTEFGMQTTTITSFMMTDQGSGGAGNATGTGFGNDDGALTLSPGTAGSGAWRSVAIASNSGTARSLVLSTTPQRFKVQVQDSGGALTNKVYAVGLLDTTTIDSTLQAAGAADAVMFRVEAGGAGVNWFAVTKNGAATETTTDTGLADAASTNWTFEIIATTTYVTYGYCQNTSTAVACTPTYTTHTTNIPNDALIPVIGSMTLSGTNNQIRAMWWKYIGPRV